MCLMLYDSIFSICLLALFAFFQTEYKQFLFEHLNTFKQKKMNREQKRLR